MIKHILCGTALLVPLSLMAGQTKDWSQGDASDYDKAILTHLSLRSDGRLSVAPATHEIYDSSTGYLWALARDSKGVLYAGGAAAKLYRIEPGGKGKVLADLDAMEIHALVIDARDRVYAATSPDGKVYRIDSNGKAAVFYDPKAKYIWAMVFDAQGNLYVATGDRGEIHRVTPDGKGSVFYRTEESHVRSLALDGKGNLIAGTDPGGLVIRVTPAGEGFVLYQMAKREVTAVAAAPGGAIYAAAVGARTTQPVPAPLPPPAMPAQVQVVVGAGAAPAAAQPRPAPGPPPSASAAVTGGSEVWRIEPDGTPRKVWSHAQDVVYAIAFDHAGHALIGSGNKGTLYRVETPAMYTSLVTLPATQVTAFAGDAGGHLYAATANTGKVYEIGPGLEKEGSVESDVLDAGGYTLWGRLSFEGSGSIAVTTRSGNLDQPSKGWSPWSAAIANTKGARVTSPAARFLQWKATLSGAAYLDSVDVAYLPKNLEPYINEIESTPPNYRFPAPSTPLVPLTQSLVLPPMGKHQPAGGVTTIGADATPAMQYAKGFIGARWSAGDPNGDPLVYTVEIKGEGESQWKLLRDKVNERYLSWDSTAFPDGWYRLRVTAGDAPGNPPGEALTAREESSPLLIDNTPPAIAALGAQRGGTKLTARWHAADALSNIVKCEYSLDGSDWKVVAPVTRLSDSPALDYELTVDAAPGEHTIAVRVEDDYGNQSVEKTVVK
ncbi:MAG: SMP-30/gluconolactonase/LRE family protein [Acidobacteria bacterium]|nr:SMP-30/gluconolactonase/LRE family protein [Acidobacteriota bacterium]